MAGLTGERYAFTQDNASKAPDQKGVYQIEASDGTLIFVGQGDISARLLSHLRRENTADACIFRHNPTQYRREVCADAEDKESRLLSQFSTLCNQRIG